MKLRRNGLAWSIEHAGETLLRCDKAAPLIYVGKGAESVEMYRGNYRISDYVTERRPLTVRAITDTENGFRVDFGEELSMECSLFGSCAELHFTALNPELNRFWFRVPAKEEECCWGCGEQMSYFNLRGRSFPLWVSEPGVGRDKTTYVTWRSDVENKAGGDYYNTNFPQPTFVSSRRYYLHVDTTAYAEFDFRNPGFHELQVWEIPESIRMEAAPTFLELLKKESAFFGRQAELPDWVYDGVILGVQGGSERSLSIAEKVMEGGVKIAGIWCQDWSGRRITSFGKRVNWNWRWGKELYPGLPETIRQLHRRGIRFLGYVSPYLVEDGDLFVEGKKLGVFARRPDGGVYLVDFGEFHCGVVDFTNPAAARWFKDRVLKENMLDIGIDGYMTDFGEYLPTDDILLYSGASPMLEHNRWPVRWAKCNYEALAESGKLETALTFMRAGGAGSQKYCQLLWAGDQCVDFSRHDGLCTVICAALSAGMTGCGLTHSDIGGYTSLFGTTRTKEVFLRWAEMAAFTPVMRTHEGNRPEANFQFYDDEDAIGRMARLVDVHRMLAPYIKALVKENAESGIPVQRPLFLHNEDDQRCYTEQFEYLLGPDLLVAPVWQEGKSEWEVYLPAGEWIHLWSGKAYGGGTHTTAAPLGEPPVFYKKSAGCADLFRSVRRKYGCDGASQ